LILRFGIRIESTLGCFYRGLIGVTLKMTGA
jgi:hypothetical protein